MTLATESIVNITVEWSTGTIIYSDKTAVGKKGAIINLDVIAHQGRVGDVGSVGSVNVTLDDTDGTLKTVYDACKIEGTKCTIEQVFTGGVAKTVILLVGKICADIVWNEGERTLSFGIESLYRDNQIGYAPKDGDYAWLHPDAIGIPWPICFGTVLRVPAIRVLKSYDLSLGEDVKYLNPATFTVVGGEFLPQDPTVIDLSVGEVLFRGTMTGDQFTPTIWNMPKYINITVGARIASDSDYNNPSVFWLEDDEELLQQYVLWCYDTVNYQVNHITHQEGKKCWCDKPWDTGGLPTTGDIFSESARYPRTSWPETQHFDSDLSGETLLTIAKDGWTLQKDAVIYYSPGSGITDRYICNLVISEEVVEVFAHRTFYGKKIFCAVPSSYYTVNLDENLSGRHVTSITMTRPLSSRFCEGWEDDLYVSLISSISPPDIGVTPGGNTSVIIDWILSIYTDLAIDATSFTNVETLINNYPSHFAIFDQPNAVEVCQEIAWQARCALVIINGTVYLKYLPEIGTSSPVETITNALTEFKTVNLGLLPTESVITKIKATWIREYSGEKLGIDGEKPERILEKELNVATYGLHELNKNFFIYNIGENVTASVNFWLRRLSNVWKTISCNAFIDIDAVNTFDHVLFNITGLSFPGGGAKGQLEYIGHNTGEPIVELQATLAIKAGETAHSSDFWTVDAGSTEDILDGLATYDYEIASDGTCPTYTSIFPNPSPKYHFVFTETPGRIPRNVEIKIKAEIQDEDGNLVTDIDPAFATLEIHCSHPKDVVNQATIDMTFTGGRWNNAGAAIIIAGGDKSCVSHLWIKSKDKRIWSSNRKIGSQ